MDTPATDTETSEDQSELLSPDGPLAWRSGWGRRGYKVAGGAVVALGLLGLLAWVTAGGTALQSSNLKAAVQEEALSCAWQPNTNAWAPDHGALGNIDGDVLPNDDFDAIARPKMTKDECEDLCRKTAGCGCVVYYDISPLKALWKHGNGRCWRRTSCPSPVADPGYETCIMPTTTISGSLVLSGVDYDALVADPALKAAFETKCKNIIASFAGTDADNVQITISLGSVKVTYTVTVPSASATATSSALTAAVGGTLATDLVTALNSISEITTTVASGTMSVADVTTTEG